MCVLLSVKTRQIGKQVQFVCLNAYRKKVNKNTFGIKYVQWEHFLVFCFTVAKH